MEIERVNELIKREIEMAVGEFGLEIDRIILFGSRARGDHSFGSDWDILLVLKGKAGLAQERRLAKAIRERLAEHLIDVDILVRSQEEFELYRGLLGTVTREASKEGIPI